MKERMGSVDGSSAVSGLTGAGGETVALLGVEVRAEVVAGHACATVRQRYRNEEKKPIEAIYTFPLPTRSVLTGFSMTVDGRRLEGEVREREDAFRKYDEAITAGHGGALLEQERPNVFTANVGNLLPGEETILEVQYVEPLLADEGAVRWSVPTLVAPRYIPGVASGDRTAHGTAQPTDRVPDADRISPPIGSVAYGLALDLLFDLGVEVDVESPSHKVVVQREGGKTRVTFAQKEVPLDRDVVVTAFARSSAAGPAPIATAVTHRDPASGKSGALALTLVPDLGIGTAKSSGRGSEVVFVLDRSGSMGGASMPEAQTALRLCLRQLREGDRFNILAFDDSIEAFAPETVPFTQATLQRADQWLAGIDARGGTELLAPMEQAAKLVPDGIVVLLTDGEVGNEDEILQAFLAARQTARVYSFGICTNVSDALLQALADKTAGAVEMIHPGERIDEKVVAQFARATARRVTDVTIKPRGIELGELAPAEPRPLVDGEPFCLFATYEEPGHGALEIRGKLDGEAFYLEVPVDLLESSDRPAIGKLWAQARIRDLERANVAGRRADAMKDRIVKLAVEHGVSSKFTSFVVVEKRTGDRRVNEQAETRVVPVSAPAEWDMFARRSRAKGKRMYAAAPMAMSLGGTGRVAQRGGGMAPPGAPRSAPMPPPRAAGGAPFAPAPPPAMRPAPIVASAPPMPARELKMAKADLAKDMGSAGVRPSVIGASRAEREESFDDDLLAGSPSLEEGGGGAGSAAADPVLAVLGRQRASGLWERHGQDSAEASIAALLDLLRLGLTTAHPVHGAQIKKGVDALVAHLTTTSALDPRMLELGLAIAWVLATGRRTRQAIDALTRERSIAGLTAALGDETLVRARIDALAV